MTMVKNAGRRSPERDRTWGEYKAALPATTEELCAKLGLSLRRLERSLGILRRFELIEQRDGVWHDVQV